MVTQDAYKSILSPATGEVKEKGSKFLAYAYPFNQENELKPIIEKLKQEHPQACHWCYAYRIGADGETYRANDDGEPSNSAGTPILGQLLSMEITDCLVVVVRYFGGTKLGVGGLISAYKLAAQDALKAATTCTKYVSKNFLLKYPYDKTNDVKRLLNDYEVTINKEEFTANCQINLSVRNSEADAFYKQMVAYYGIEIKPLT